MSFRGMLLVQLNRHNGRFEIEFESGNRLYVWDTQEEKGTHYLFDDEGNLEDIY
jgi:hypothetical protein